MWPTSTHVWLFSRCQETLKFTLNLCLVDDKVLVVSTAFKLFPLAPIETHALVLQLMQGEEGRWESAVASISSEHSQRFLLEHNSHYTLKTHSRSVQIPNIHSPFLCTCPRTYPQTCSGWPRWRGEPVWHCLAGGNTLWKWHCHLKQTKQARLSLTNTKEHRDPKLTAALVSLGWLATSNPLCGLMLVKTTHHKSCSSPSCAGLFFNLILICYWPFFASLLNLTEKINSFLFTMEMFLALHHNFKGWHPDLSHC